MSQFLALQGGRKRGQKTIVKSHSIAILAIICVLFISCLGPTDQASADVNGSTAVVLSPAQSGLLAPQVSVARPRYSSSSLLVRLELDQSAVQVATSLQVQGFGVKTHQNFPGLVSVTVPPGVSLEAAQEYLISLPQVAGAKPHLLLYQLDIPVDIPNDSFFIEDPNEYPNQYYLYDVNAPAAWYVQKGLASTVIGIVDSGISIYHEDLAANIVPGRDFVGSNIGYTTDDPDSWDYNATVWDPAWGQPDEKEPPFLTLLEGNDDPLWDPTGTAAWWETHYDSAIGDCVDNDQDGYTLDSGVTHGTLVAGIAGAVTNNNEQTPVGSLAGMAWNSSLMSIRIINAEGWGFGVDAADAIIYAADHGVDIINCSWGFGPVWSIADEEFDPGGEAYLVQQAIEYAAGKGVIIVAAAGNSAGHPFFPNYETMGGGLDFPANLPETISVGAIDWDGKIASYSSWANLDYEQYGEVLDIVAPGDMACSTGLYNAYMYWWGGFLYPANPLGEDTYEATPGGTSFTAPLVSGFAGLAYSRHYGLTYQEFREAIRETAYQPAGDTDPLEHHKYGYGCLDAYEALLYIDPAAIPEPATVALFAIGLAGLAARLRRRS